MGIMTNSRPPGGKQLALPLRKLDDAERALSELTDSRGGPVARCTGATATAVAPAPRVHQPPGPPTAGAGPGSHPSPGQCLSVCSQASGVAPLRTMPRAAITFDLASDQDAEWLWSAIAWISPMTNP